MELKMVEFCLFWDQQKNVVWHDSSRPVIVILWIGELILAR